MHAETFRKRVRQAEADSGKRAELLSSQEREEIRRLRMRLRGLNARVIQPGMIKQGNKVSKH